MVTIKDILKYSNKQATSTVFVSELISPIGNVICVADDNFLYLVAFEDSKNIDKRIKTIAEHLKCSFIDKSNTLLENFQDELDLYFKGDLKKFSVPVKTIGSEFQKQVWNKLLELPFGSTQTYGELAKSMGRASSHSRAIGSACGANSHLIIIPCHRLVSHSSNGGFNSGGEKKDWLLDHESKI